MTPLEWADRFYRLVVAYFTARHCGDDRRIAEADAALRNAVQEYEGKEAKT